MNSETLMRPERDLCWGSLTGEERRQADYWLRMVRRIEAADNPLEEIARIVQEQGHVRGVSKSTLYRKREAFRAHGVAGLVRRRCRHRAGAAPLPAEFVRWWQGLCGLHQRKKVAAVYRHLFTDWLCAGKTIPGYDADWRGIWSREHGREAPAECPYRPYDATPHGWSYRSLCEYAPDEDVWTAAAVGPWAASAYLPKVPHTRIGLELGQIYVIDDVEHDLKVNFPGQAEAQRPVELGALELLTGHYASFGICPVRLRADGTREKLKEAYVRYLLVDLLCRIGIHPKGVLILSEHGTAAVRSELMERIRSVCGPDMVRVEAGNCFGEPLVAGLFAARPRGNPRWKAALESHHNLKHNMLGMLPGQVGMDRDRAPEEATARDRENKLLTAAADALALDRPDIAAAMARPYVEWTQFLAAVAELYRRVAYRHDHRLEGFAECGFTVQEFRLDESMPWLPMDRLDAMPPERKAVALALIDSCRGLAKCRVMSPAEAWNAAAVRTELKRYPMSVAAVLLGPELGQVRPVERDGTVALRAEGSPRVVRYQAIATDDRGAELAIPRETKILCHVNPMNWQQCLASLPDGRYLGTLRALEATMHGDREAEQTNLGLRQKAVMDRARRLAPVAEAQVRRRMDAAEINAGLLLDADPVETAAETATDKRAMRGRARREVVEAEELAGWDLPAFREDGDAAEVTLEEMEALCPTAG